MRSSFDSVKDAGVASPAFSRSSSISPTKPPKRWTFDFKKAYDDEENLWYVGVTRAKDVLSVPSKFMDVLINLESIQRHRRPLYIPSKMSLPTTMATITTDMIEEEAPVIFGRQRSPEEVKSLHSELYLPFRRLLRGEGRGEVGTDGGFVIDGIERLKW